MQAKMRSTSLLILTALLNMSKMTYGQQEAPLLPSEVKEASDIFIGPNNPVDAHHMADAEEIGALLSGIVARNASRSVARGHKLFPLG